MLALVVLYNISFFQKRRAGVRRSSPPALQETTVQRTDPARRAEDDYRPAWRRDPFWYPGGTEKRGAVPAPAAEPRTSDELRLEGTSMSGGKGYALINGKVYGVGDRVNELEVAEIDETSVTLKGRNGARIIQILGGKTRKE
jgi:hypothetical protein